MSADGWPYSEEQWIKWSAVDPQFDDDDAFARSLDDESDGEETDD